MGEALGPYRLRGCRNDLQVGDPLSDTTQAFHQRHPDHVHDEASESWCHHCVPSIGPSGKCLFFGTSHKPGRALLKGDRAQAWQESFAKGALVLKG